MAGTLRKMRVKLAFYNYRVGDVITPNGTTRDELKARGYIEEIEDARPAKMSHRAAAKFADAANKLSSGARDLLKH